MEDKKGTINLNKSKEEPESKDTILEEKKLKIINLKKVKKEKLKD